MNSFRKLTLAKIALSSGININNCKYNVNGFKKYSGILTNLVETSLNTKFFKEKFLELPPGPQREKFVYDSIIQRKPLTLVPITVTAPNGTKITYKVMPDYITIDGIRVPMSGKTAQKVADFFGMHLPTTKQSRQIWENADVKIRPTPLSAGGKIGNKYYSGQEVVNHKISDSDSALAYSNLIQKEIQQHKGPKNLIAGHMKDIVAPENPNKLGLYGWWGKDGKPLEPSKVTSHDTNLHSEYGAGTRLVDDTVKLELPDGSVKFTSIRNVLNDPTLFSAISESKGVKRYF